MTAPTNTPTRDAAMVQPNEVERNAGTLSVRRLNVMRIGYAVMGIGLAIDRWPQLFNRTEPWPLYEGATAFLLVAMGLLALLGLRYPVKMLPIMVFESLWTLLWLAVIALPLAIAGTMDTATSEMAAGILLGLIVVAVTPWRYVFRQYVTTAGDPWRSRSAREARETL